MTIVNEGATTSGCYKQKLDGYETEVCACRSRIGQMPCNSASTNRVSLLAVILAFGGFLLIKGRLIKGQTFTWQSEGESVIWNTVEVVLLDHGNLINFFYKNFLVRNHFLNFWSRNLNFEFKFSLNSNTNYNFNVNHSAQELTQSLGLTHFCAELEKQLSPAHLYLTHKLGV